MPPPGRMQERASPRTRGEIAREAKGLALALKEMLKRKDPWDQEVNFQRLNLRKQYLSLIFRHPHSSTSSSTSSKPHAPTHVVESLNLLWLDTSHALIQLYRHKLNALDQAAQANTSRPRRPQPGHGQGQGQNPAGPVARRRLVHAFRQFLAEEEKFWRDQLVRIVQTYGLDRAESALRALGITVVPGLWDADEAVLPASHAGAGGEAAYGSSANGGNQARTAEEFVRREGLLLCHKALICYGDLARYRELAGDFPPGMGNSKGHSKGKDRRREGEKKTTTTQVAMAAAEGESAAAPGAAGGGKKERCWNRAAECYHQARLLAPENGNPSNQLAVISAYAGDTLSSSYHYYRALCVKQPFTTAKGNLELTYSKAVMRWQRAPDYRLYCERMRDGGSELGSAAMEPTSKDVAVFKTDFVALHGLFYLRKTNPAWQDLNLLVTDAFEALVATRSLPSEVIVKVVISGLCSLWVSRMRLGEVRKTKTETSHEELMQQPATEMAILTHILDITRILLTIAYTETKDVAPSQQTSNDAATDEGGSGRTSNPAIAENITAVLRRTLPALRIAIKWVVADLDYIRRSTRQALAPPPSSDSDTSNQVYLFPELVGAVNAFWAAYADFANVFSVVFPLQDLPDCDGVLNLEEDVDTLGFLPLRRGPDLSASVNTGGPIATGDRPLAMALPAPQVHPNEEQLARVADLLGMTNLISGVEASPLKKVDKRFVIDAVALEHGVTMDVSALDALPLPPFNLGEHAQDPEGEVGDQSTEDDPVDLAMRAATGAGIDVIDFDDFENEEDLDRYKHRRQSNPISRPVGAQANPAQVPGQGVSATPPPPAQASPRRLESEEQRRPSLLPHHLPPAPARPLQPLQTHSTTAADLLSAVMSGNAAVSAPPPGLSHAYGASNIWAPVPASASSSSAIFAPAQNVASSPFGQQPPHAAPPQPPHHHGYPSPSIWNNSPVSSAAPFVLPGSARYAQSTSVPNLPQQQYFAQQPYAQGQPYQHAQHYGPRQSTSPSYGRQQTANG